MHKVFVSHAGADAKYVDKFVDTIFRMGCGMRPEDIFYTSSTDTGVPNGEDLFAYIRTVVGEGSLLVAVITPTYQARPVCIAELGAAWSRTGALFPMLAPGMKRDSLEGVIPSLMTRPIEADDALDELKDRVSQIPGYQSSFTTWGKYKAQWIGESKRLAKYIPGVPNSPALVKAEKALADTQAALDEAYDKIEQLEEQVETISALKDPGEVTKAKLPKDVKSRFEVLVKAARKALAELPEPVQLAAYHDAAGTSMRWPDAFDNRKVDELNRAIDDGYIEDADGALYLRTDMGDVGRALEAVQELRNLMSDETQTEFLEWFHSDYNMPPELGRKKVWDALLG